MNCYTEAVALLTFADGRTDGLGFRVHKHESPRFGPFLENVFSGRGGDGGREKGDASLQKCMTTRGRSIAPAATA